MKRRSIFIVLIAMLLFVSCQGKNNNQKEMTIKPYEFSEVDGGIFKSLNPDSAVVSYKLDDKIDKINVEFWSVEDSKLNKEDVLEISELMSKEGIIAVSMHKSNLDVSVTDMKGGGSTSTYKMENPYTELEGSFVTEREEEDEIKSSKPIAIFKQYESNSTITFQEFNEESIVKQVKNGNFVVVTFENK